ncbi:hypothetical protein NP233_g7945 [Leucocoprinus birnbaumii]|uniref:Uncharacterized protein n=1 Tax=Leucocoprinus birnbaumii TaxID=56174 RepID=A0AAD5YPH6_9AGAR|nr:hypothetical protein NP233_g7945 [Leucocoprinus birnbaumii]
MDSIHLFHAFHNIPSSPYFPYCNNAGEPTLDLELPKHLKFGPRFQNRKLVNCFVMRDQEDPDVKPGNKIGAKPCEKRAIWKYNTSIHALIHHPQQHPSILDVLVPADLPGEMLVASHISKDEERYMGILEHKTASYRHEFAVPGSDDPVLQGATKGQKRSRKATVSQVEPPKTKKNRS